MAVTCVQFVRQRLPHLLEHVECRGGVEPCLEYRGGENLVCEWKMSNPRDSYVIIVVSICVSCKPTVPSSSLWLCTGIPFINQKTFKLVRVVVYWQKEGQWGWEGVCQPIWE